LGGLGYLRWIQGDFKRGREIGELLLAYGEKTANSRDRCMSFC
jgi:hypothetical protein